VTLALDDSGGVSGPDPMKRIGRTPKFDDIIGGTIRPSKKIHEMSSSDGVEYAQGT
jgi:hypothetical protein